jgi:hypothetical protein
MASNQCGAGRVYRMASAPRLKRSSVVDYEQDFREKPPEIVHIYTHHGENLLE